jgi:uncharacterized protein YprB with RNaseH-like and TPR domain
MINSLNQENLEKVLFLDIETVPEVKNFYELSERKQKFWIKKVKRVDGSVDLPMTDEECAKLFNASGGLHAEFGKIVCITTGYFANGEFNLKSFYNTDEKILLQEFATDLNNFKWFTPCGHNAKEFDFPWLNRRLLINGITTPSILDFTGKKPWDIKVLDTKEIWKFGQYKGACSLDLLAELFGIESPKDDIAGKDVYTTYYQDKDLHRIKVYCEKDVVTLAKILCKWAGKPINFGINNLN